MPKIKLNTPDGAKLEFDLTVDRATFGRAEDNDIVIPDGSVSSRHGEFHSKGDAIEIVDLGSTNGTHVDGKRVERATIEPGGKFRLGSVEGTVVGEPAAPTAPATAPAPPAEEPESEETPESSGGHLSLPMGGGAVVTGLGATPCPTGQRVGFGPKAKEKDSVGSLLIFLAVLSLVVCAAAAYMIFKMEA
jgi:hypothetical protein